MLASSLSLALTVTVLIALVGFRRGLHRCQKCSSISKFQPPGRKPREKLCSHLLAKRSRSSGAPATMI